MLQRRWMGLVLSFLLGAAGLVLLVVISLPDTPLLLPKSAGVIGLILILIVAVIAAIFLLIREVVRRIWQEGVEHMRIEALGEHHRFLCRLDHELKNPLTALRAGLASLALTLVEEDQRRIVHTMADEAQRLSRLVTDLRKLAELETISLDIQTIDVATLCGDISDLVDERFTAYDRLVRFECSTDREPPSAVIGDPDLLLLAVHNLLDNALKYTRGGDTIRVSVALEQDELVIQVADSGVGISDTEQALVWEELYRGKNASSIPGSGIGLALVKTIVERHDGTVQLTSAVDVGTTVSLRIPLN